MKLKKKQFLKITSKKSLFNLKVNLFFKQKRRIYVSRQVMTQLQNCGSKEKKTKFQRTHKESSDPFCYFTISCSSHFIFLKEKTLRALHALHVYRQKERKKDMCVMSLGSNMTLRKFLKRIVCMMETVT